MSLKILIGKNKSGKTKYLNKEYSNKDNDNIFFIPAEIDLDDALKGNFGTPKYEDLAPHVKIVNFLNKILVESSFQYKLSDEEIKKINEKMNKIQSVFDTINEDDDPYFENVLKSSIDLNKEFQTKTEITVDLLKHISQKQTGESGSSGSLNYSLIKLLYKLITFEEFKLNKNVTLVIDEIEKFLHPELVYKVADMVDTISEHINVVVTTHSPVFYEKILLNHKLKIKQNKTIENHYLYFCDSEVPKELNPQKMNELLKTQNYRMINNFAKILFCTNVFLVEGLIDNSFINDVIYNEPELRKHYYTIIDCFNKGAVKEMYRLLSELELLEYINLCLFYDLDKNQWIKLINEKDDELVTSIANNPDIEQTFLDSIIKVKKDENVRLFLIKSNKSKDKILEIKASEIKKEILPGEEIPFIFGIDWIKQHSTKNINEIETKFNDIKKQITNFLNKNKK